MNSRLLHVIASLTPGGQAAQLVTLARALAVSGHAVRVIALRDGPLRRGLEEAGVQVDVLPQRHLVDPLVIMRLRRLARDWRPATVHTWDRAATACTAAAGVGPIVASLRQASDWAAGRVDRAVGRYLAASQTVAEALLAAGVASDRVLLIPPAVEPQPTADVLTPEQTRAELGLPAKARVIAVVSRLVPAKNLRELIWCADLLHALNDATRLVVFGDGPARGEIERFARMAGDPELVRFAGHRDDVRQLLASCEVFWQAGAEPSVPNALLEAMAAGLPVVADSTPGARQAVVAGETGYLVPIAGRADRARATRELLEQPERCQQQGNAGKQRAAEVFSVAALRDACLEQYDRLQPEHAAAAG